MARINYLGDTTPRSKSARCCINALSRLGHLVTILYPNVRWRVYGELEASDMCCKEISK
jgi:hypothetical protein